MHLSELKNQIKTLQITLKKTSELIPYARNSRIHSTKQVKQIADSIKEFGFLVPCVVREDGTIVCGHGRILAAGQLKIEEIPTISTKHLTESQIKAFTIADNQIALNAEWDDEMLQLELTDLRESDFDLDLIGFGDVENFEFDPPNEDGKDPVKDLTLRITFEDEEEQQALFCELRDRGFKVKT